MTQEKLRKRVRIIKAVQQISYKEISSYLEIKESSFYNWLRNQYDLSSATAARLADILDNLED